MTDFQKEVIEVSHSKPVLVDFWAEWCGPCRVLGPILDEVADERKHEFKLVKIDTEAHQDLAYQYRIRSIPNVKLFYKGEVTAEFAGLMPKASIEEWLDDHIPNDEKSELKQLLSEMSERSIEENYRAFEAFHRNHPTNHDGKLMHNRYSLLKNEPIDTDFLESIKMSDKNYDLAQYIMTWKHFMESEIEDESRAGAALKGVQTAMEIGAYENALDALVKSVMLDKNYNDELPRRLGVALFNILGDGNPIVHRYRRKFDMALY